ncbi:TetR-like C-terminal domain-containing protein [Jannaschia sp. LMIT008]|uniref:TetR/AcrR family transcriptional regulator n=1 Tax=Jannaschia maritima TaxID=3032585 RepID=UPI00281241B8|nr:TetR-like C-terminal domain-containing protein [Jannaschia sp. LMIT008]
MTAGRATTKRYHHGDLRAELVRIGRMQLESEDAPSLRGIARQADVSHGAPVHHFPTWAHLMAACAADGFRELSRDLAETSAPDGAPGERLGRMAAAYLAFAQRNPVVFRLMFNRSALTERTDEFLAESGAAYALLRRAVRDLDPEMSDERFDTLINTVWGLIHGISVLELEEQICRSSGETTATAAFLERSVRRLIEG